MKIGIISELIHERNNSGNVLEKILNRFGINYRTIYENNFELFCVRQGKKNKIVYDCEFINSLKDSEILYNIEVTALEIPYRRLEFDRVSEKILKKYMYFSLQKLKGYGIDRIAFTDGIKEIYATEDLSREILGRDFSFSVICNLCELIKKLSAKCGIDPLKTQFGVISKVYMPEIYETIKTLVYDVGYIKIYTNEIAEFSDLCEKLYSRFGIVVDVYEYRTVDRVNDLIICDFDTGILKVGRDILVTNVKYKLNIGEYNVNDIEILDLICENPKNFGIKYCICGKNRLTI